MKIVLRIIFGIAFLLVAFFGLGPVVLADGMMEERILTLIVVLVIFSVLYVLYKWFMKKSRD
jgi:amino acid permease